MLNGLEFWVTRYRTGTATDVVVVVVVDIGYGMSGYLTREEKKKYEQSRRGQVMRDARDHRLLTRWLMRVQPDSLAKFYAFKAELQSRYPLRKDLSKAPAFVEFMYGGNDVRFQPERMTVPLVDMLQQSQYAPLKPEPNQQLLSIETVAVSTAPLEPEPNQQLLTFETVAGSTAPLIFGTKVDSTVPLSEHNPFCLLDEEIDELLRGLEGVDVEEVKALDIDHELSAVLNMNVDDFVV